MGMVWRGHFDEGIMGCSGNGVIEEVGIDVAEYRGSWEGGRVLW